MPWQGNTLIGTTEVEVSTPAATPSPPEIEYLLETARHYFPHTPTDLLASFAGVRVLPASSERPFARARESVIAQSNTDATLISIYGGKLTTFRHTAEQVMRLLRKGKSA
jgi:glycerol-3-phosphate dehydrogenase